MLGRCGVEAFCVVMLYAATLHVVGLLAMADSVRALSSPREIHLCTNKSCRKHGAADTRRYLKDLAEQHINVVTCGCIGNCNFGPNIRCGDPDQGKLYSAVKVPLPLPENTLLLFYATTLLLALDQRLLHPFLFFCFFFFNYFFEISFFVPESRDSGRDHCHGVWGRGARFDRGSILGVSRSEKTAHVEGDGEICYRVEHGGNKAS